jgi:hypothetical protein
MGTTPPTPPAVDPSAGPSPTISIGPGMPGLWRFRCAVCPDARAGGFDTQADAEASYRLHARRPAHRRHLAAWLEAQADG